MSRSEPFQLLPELSPAEFASLKADIAIRGVVVPVVVDADSGEIIDGHHRLRAWSELRAAGARVGPCPRDVRRFASDSERIEAAVSLNLARRHLSRAQRAELARRLRSEGWSLRHIGQAAGVHHDTVRDDLGAVGFRHPASVTGLDGKAYPTSRTSIIVTSERDQARAVEALRDLGDDAPAKLLGLNRAEERVRVAGLARRREAAANGPPEHEGAGFELRTGDFREALSDIADGSIDAIVTDPPYDDEHVPLYEDLGRFAARVLKPGRLAAVYAGHMRLDDQINLLAAGGLSYVWHGANVLNGRSVRIRTHMIFGHHRSVLLFSAGQYRPRRWIHDLAVAEGRGGAGERPLHPWQQALEPVRHWVHMVSEPGELICEPFLGSGTTAIAALLEGRRVIGCDLDPGAVKTTAERLESGEPRLIAERR
ncbi:MAG: DNA methyltransferase [Acidimicrobiales bacterium]